MGSTSEYSQCAETVEPWKASKADKHNEDTRLDRIAWVGTGGFHSPAR